MNKRIKRVVLSSLKFILCLLIIGLFGLIILNTFTIITEGTLTPEGFVVVIIEVAVSVGLILALKTRRLRWRFPSFKLVLFPLLAVALILAFIGVWPFESIGVNTIVEIPPTEEVNVPPDVTHPPIIEITPVPPPETYVTVIRSDICLDIIKLTNDERVNYGLSVLVEDDYLSSLALDQCEYMKKEGYCNHDGFDDRADLVFNKGHLTVGENVAEGYFNAQNLVGGWMASMGHRENILNPSFHRIGVGYLDGYSCQIFSD